MKWSEVLIVILAVVLSGCVVRSYPVVKDRIDQDLTAGNRGYLKGQSSVTEDAERKSVRTTHVVEVEFKPWVTFEKASQGKAKEVAEAPSVETTEDSDLMGNRGFITQSEVPEAAESFNVEKYTVQKGDTLQKISKKFYGTTKKWMKVYEANKDALKAPDRIYPGQVINVPVEESKEIPVHLK
ncbi:MAG: LysM peptidoglycan-binding domain-containing protein [Candidatus Omnitrophota bacterium]